LNESKGITRATNARTFYQKSAFIVQMDRIQKKRAPEDAADSIKYRFSTIYRILRTF
jgi:hypothetical protein